MRSNMFPKMCGVGSSLLLVAGFVSYRAGAFDWLATSRGVQPEILTAPDQDDVGGSDAETRLVPVNTFPANSGEHLLYGSKFGAVFVEQDVTIPIPNPPTSEAAGEPPVLMSGSKSLQMIPVAPTPDDTVDEATPEIP